MPDTGLFFIQGDQIFHLGNLFPEIARIKPGTQDGFIQMLNWVSVNFSVNSSKPIGSCLSFNLSFSRALSSMAA